MKLTDMNLFINSFEIYLQKVEKNIAAKTNENGRISNKKLDNYQKLLYDIAWAESLLFLMKEMVNYSNNYSDDSLEVKLSLFFIADGFHDIMPRFLPYLTLLDQSLSEYLDSLQAKELENLFASYLNEHFANEIIQQIEKENYFGDYKLTEEQKMMQDAFSSFAKENVEPIAEEVHRKDLSIPESIIQGLASMGCFGLSIPESYGGFQSNEQKDHVSIAIVTEELSKASLGIAGSLITRPEILAKALLEGGTEKQKQKWLNALSLGKIMCAIAVTEPDYGSNVAGIKVTAKKVEGGWFINGTKTWCTFAGRANVILVLARTNPDLTLKHKGLSILLAEKPATDKHDFQYTQEKGGKITGKAISTIGYRGMHSYEVSFEDYFVPHENLVGEENGLGKGFYMQMAGFAGGRFQTAARANGVMQAALEKSLQYCKDRKVFDQPIIKYGITQYKLAKMASIVQASRQGTFASARLLDKKEGQMEASLIKFYSSKIAEWLTREAMQLHGGMGYAEEYAVSRYFLDARVFSIFEGAEDVLALKVISKNIIEREYKK